MEKAPSRSELTNHQWRQLVHQLHIQLLGSFDWDDLPSVVTTLPPSVEPNEFEVLKADRTAYAGAAIDISGDLPTQVTDLIGVLVNVFQQEKDEGLTRSRGEKIAIAHQLVPFLTGKASASLPDFVASGRLSIYSKLKLVKRGQAHTFYRANGAPLPPIAGSATLIGDHNYYGQRLKSPPTKVYRAATIPHLSGTFMPASIWQLNADFSMRAYKIIEIPGGTKFRLDRGAHIGATQKVTTPWMAT